MGKNEKSQAKHENYLGNSKQQKYKRVVLAGKSA